MLMELRRPRVAVRPLVYALAMTTFVAIYERWALGLPYGSYFHDVWMRSSPVGVLVRLTAVAAVIGVQILFFWASFASSRPWRAVYLAGFVFATFVEYGYVKVTGQITSAVDVRVALENANRWRSMAGMGVDWRAAVPVAVYAGALASVRPATSRSLRWGLAVVLGTLLVHGAYAAAGDFARGQQSDGMMTSRAYVTGTMQAFARSVTLFGWDELVERVPTRTRQTLTYRAAAMPTGSVAFVIDESIRGDHLSVDGYGRPTTPWLDSLQARGGLTNWGIVASGSTESDPSVLALLTGASLPDRDFRAFAEPTLFQYAKAMNYQTHMFDGESDLPRVGLTLADLRFVDDYRSATFFGEDPDTDTRMAAAARQVLQSPGQFIVVLKRGDHLPYDANFPGTAVVWSRGDNASQRAMGWNSYDDGLRYNVDRFFQALLGSEGSLPQTVVLYTSDHGQPFDPANDADFRIATSVPLLMFGDTRPRVDTAYLASHANLFATLLDLMQFPGAERPVIDGRSLLTATSGERDPRMVHTGNLWGQGPYWVKDYDALSPERMTSRGPNVKTGAVTTDGDERGR